MKVDVQVETVIDRPRDLVASYAGEPINAPKWYTNIDSVVWKTPPPMRVGSRMTFVARFLGRRLEYTYEVAEYVPGQRLVMRTTDGPFAMETTYTWTDAGAGKTRMALRNRGGPTGFAGIAAPLMAASVRRSTSKDLAGLKKLLESSR